ncbi:hypothetical protein J1N35_011761 [Gossypium stocksii]|uniref:Uncharacterized protein n=1 Tax=Gossypium stocksii TaxID=47602 RepID=A0A9D3W440_9ROSI|nr:hypothetical protein J1N35_011761 [Gossypium stocksii]
MEEVGPNSRNGLIPKRSMDTGIVSILKTNSNSLSKGGPKHSGQGVTVDLQTCNMLEQNDPNPMVQCIPTVVGNTSKGKEVVVLNTPAEGVHHSVDQESVPLKQNTPVLQEQIGVSVEVGSLDSNKHSGVVFPDSANQKFDKKGHYLKSTVNSTRMNPSGMGKGLKKKGRGITKKYSRILQGNMARFKSSDPHQVLLKESMVEVAEKLSGLGGDDLAAEVIPIFGQFQRDAETPEQQ